MKLFDLLKHLGLFSKDIRTRSQNKQITINGEVVEGNIDIPQVVEVWNYGYFIEVIRKSNSDFNMFLFCATIAGIENIFGGEFTINNTQPPVICFLNDFWCLRLSKKNEILILKFANKDEIPTTLKIIHAEKNFKLIDLEKNDQKTN